MEVCGESNPRAHGAKCGILAIILYLVEFTSSGIRKLLAT